MGLNRNRFVIYSKKKNEKRNIHMLEILEFFEMNKKVEVGRKQ
jgi:hypothetical protein